jgi:hypothetical protein
VRVVVLVWMVLLAAASVIELALAHHWLRLRLLH